MNYSVNIVSFKGKENASRFLRDTDGLLSFGPLVEAGNYEHHGPGNTVRSHCIRTAWIAYRLCRFFHVTPEHEESAVQAALLHDLFGYDWLQSPGGDKHLFHPHVLRHIVFHGSEAVDFLSDKVNLNDRQKDAIRKHMFPAYPIPPRYCEGWIVTLADKIAAVQEYSRTAKESCLERGSALVWLLGVRKEKWRTMRTHI